MKRRLQIEIEETVTEVRIVDPELLTCPACGELFSFPRPQEIRRLPRPSKIETVFIKPVKKKALNPAKN